MTNNYYHGVDVSIMQNIIDWTSVANAGYSFCILRCYVGNSGKDTRYDINLQQATAAGLKVACYNFVFPFNYTSDIDTHSPIWQANTHFKAAGNVAIHCIDFEYPAPQDWQKWNVSAASIKAWMQRYLTEYTRLLGKPPILYTYPYFCSALSLSEDFAQYPLWIASYETVAAIPKPWTSFVLWQYGSGGQYKLPNGVPVDVDYCPSLDAIWGTLSDPITSSPDPVAGQTSTPVPPIAQPLIPAPQSTSQAISASPTTPSPTNDQNIANVFSAIWGWASNWLKK